MATDRPTGDDDRGTVPVDQVPVEEVPACDATLVLHGDGSSVCPRVEVCGAHPDLHPWWITCAELASPCGCTGDEHPGSGRFATGLLARAA
jgi:hypothetical protein